MLAIREKKRKNYTSLYLDIEIDGVRKWENLGLKLTGDKKIDKEIRAQAELIKSKRMIDIASGNYDIQLVPEERDFMEYYKKQIEINPDYERRVAVYKNLTEYLKFKKIKKLMFKDFDENFWIEFRIHLIKVKEFKLTTIKTTLAIIKAILNKAIREKILKVNPLINITEKRVHGNRIYLDWEEVQKLDEAHCNHEVVKNAFLFACYTGIRLSDIENLKRKYFWSDKISIPNMEKPDKPLLIPYSKWILKYIPNFEKLENEDLVFNMPSRSTTNTSLKVLAATAGIRKNISFHISRHTYATGILTHGGDIGTLQELLGHSDPSITKIYGKIVDEKKVKAVAGLPNLS